MAAVTAPRFDAPDLSDILACMSCDGSGLVEEVECCHVCGGTDEDCGTCDWDGDVTTVDDCYSCAGAGHASPHRDYQPFISALDGALGMLADMGWQIDFGNWCCQSCAFSADIDPARPFVGFHKQDVERIASGPGDGMRLFHHLPNGTDAETFIEVLTEAGFQVDWDRDPGTRPLVTRA